MAPLQTTQPQANTRQRDKTHWSRHLLQGLDIGQAVRSRNGWIIAWSFTVLAALSSVLLCVGDSINAPGVAVTRFLAREQAPLVGQRYPTGGRDRITVVAYDQAFLERSGSGWPISYGTHAQWLLRLADDPATRPRAVMLDINLVQKRNDPTLPQLQQALCTLSIKHRVPVYLAGMHSAVDGLLHTRPGLEEHDGQGRRCFTLVGVNHWADPLDGQAWTYPVSTYLAKDGWDNGPAPEGQVSYRSASIVMAQEVEGLDLGPEVAPMALVWGTQSAASTTRSDRLYDCDPQPSVWLGLLPALVRPQTAGAAQKPPCPPQATLAMSSVMEMEPQELAPLIKDKYVFVGAFFDGSNDFVSSPVHGLLPGVYLHAMALDNLLVFKGNYKLATDWSKPGAEMLLAGLLGIAAVFAVRAGWALVAGHVIDWWSRFCKPRGAVAWRIAAAASARITAWLLLLLLQAAVAMLLIAALQQAFRIGMLPVTELVTMTLLAEGLGLMSKLAEFMKPYLSDPESSTEASPGHAAASIQQH